MEKRLDARFRQNLRRRRRRLEEHGPVTFEIVTGGDALDQALEDCFAIEASGWKGAEGSAIRARPELVGFYSAWARQLAQKKALRLCFLKVGEKRVAFHFAFVFNNRYYLPKCGFDEAFYECSPGQLLIVDVLKYCMEQKLETFEFLGFSMPWKRDWTPLVRPHATLMAYRPTRRGRLSHVVRTEVRPRAAKWIREAQSRIAAWRGAK
jgi:CelD/BcsL family acetyltransferase involved in cellulose biosynthesis